jgi:WhiB family transcriptional regulator, redox-sensing transcriptional regulator
MPVFSPASAAVPPPGPTGAVGRGVSWQHNAACLTEDPELFFPIGSTGPAVWQAEEAKTVCRRCPVMTQCLTWALDTGIEHGVWGGQTEEERRALRRRRARARISRSA